MRRSTASALLGILVLAAVLRLSPLTRSLYFGSDVGEYFRISRGLVDAGRIVLPYSGWGVTYPYFPGFYFVVAGPALAGLELSAALALLVPALAALAPALVFLLSVRLLREDKAGIVAAALVAVAMPHAFQTAHAIPATLGEVLAAAALLLYLRLPSDRRVWALLVPLTGALVVTHHLSAYFLIVMVLLGLAVRGLVSAGPVPGIRGQAGYVAVLSGLSFAYWFLVATPFRTEILADVDLDPWWLPVAGFLALVLLLAGAVAARRRLSWRYRPRYPSLRHVSVTVGIALAAILAIMGYAVVVGVLGTSIRLSWGTVAYFLPFFALLSVSGAGRKHLDFARRGLDASGWFLALVLSAAFGTFAAARVLIPYRHVEYMVLLLGIPVGSGFARLFELGDLGRRKLTVVAVVGVLVAGSALTAFPPAGVLMNYEEGVRPEALDSAYWSRDHVDGLLATDHRASTVAFGFGGVDATWDTAPLAIAAPDFATARAEMCLVDAPSGPARVEYVLIDEDLAQGVQLSPFEPPSPLSPAARGKFAGSPYLKVYDDGFAQVYAVNWGLAGVACP